MKTLRFLLVAGAAALATIPALRADETVGASANRGQQWLSRYYQNPRPDDFLSAVHSLSQSGYFESAGQPATAIGFFSSVFAQNPQQVNSWLARTSGLPEEHRRILAAAAWKAGHPAGARQLRELSANVDDSLRAELNRLLDAGPTAVVQSPVLSESSLNLQWGAFLASGDERHILNVLGALGSGEPGLTASARYALAQNAISHPRVLEVCQSQLSRQPEAIRAEIRAALNEVPGAKPRT
jgi:hypothetical protein